MLLEVQNSTAVPTIPGGPPGLGFPASDHSLAPSHGKGPLATVFLYSQHVANRNSRKSLKAQHHPFPTRNSSRVSGTNLKHHLKLRLIDAKECGAISDLIDTHVEQKIESSCLESITSPNFDRYRIGMSRHDHRDFQIRATGPEKGCQSATVPPPVHPSLARRRRRAFEMTETELKVMAALAMTGLSKRPKKG